MFLTNRQICVHLNNPNLPLPMPARWRVPLLYSNHFPSNNNQHLVFNAVFCTCQVRMSQSHNPQLQGWLAKTMLKKACHSRAPFLPAVVFAQLSACCWSSWHFFFLWAVLLADWADCGCGVSRSCITNSSHSLCWGNAGCHYRQRERWDRQEILMERNTDNEKEEQRPRFFKGSREF